MSQSDQNQKSAELVVDMLGEDDVLDFVVRIDAAVGKWDFTLKLAAHFDDLRRVHAIEKALDERPARTVGSMPDVAEEAWS